MSGAAASSAPLAGLTDLVGLLLTLLALVVAYKLTRPPPVVPVTDLPVARCDLQREPCQLSLPDGELLEVSIASHPVRPNQPFTLTARSQNATLQPLAVAIHGIEIDMGSAAKAFEPDETGGYRVETSLPICTVGRMTWELSVTLQAGNRHLRWPLRFVTEPG